MATADLIGTQVVEIHFSNKIKTPSQLKLNSGFSFNVNYVPDGEHAVASLYQSLKDTDGGDQFFCSVEMRGTFKLTGQLDEAAKKQLHAQCYDAMFPYIQKQVKDLCASSGIPNMMLRKSKINPENVMVQDHGPEAQKDEPTLPIY
ncbi:MAG: protein-export chaperone SecB [Clostridiales bacterium]|nr:protein-export chaperone SecB [Clostridiales bacterium]